MRSSWWWPVVVYILYRTMSATHMVSGGRLDAIDSSVTAVTKVRGIVGTLFPAPRREHRVFTQCPSHSSHGDRPSTPSGWGHTHVVGSCPRQDPRSIA